MGSSSSSETEVETATCYDCGRSVDTLEWRELLFEDKENPEKTICIFGHNSMQTESYATRSSLSFELGGDNKAGGSVGITIYIFTYSSLLLK